MRCDVQSDWGGNYLVILLARSLWKRGEQAPGTQGPMTVPMVNDRLTTRERASACLTSKAS